MHRPSHDETKAKYLDAKASSFFDESIASITLPIGETVFQYHGDVHLHIINLDNKNIFVFATDKGGVLIYHHAIDAKDKRPVKCSHNFDKGPFTIGRRNDNTLTIAESSSISRKQASISLVDGKLIYTHLGKDQIWNPLFPRPPEIIRIIDGSNDSAGGFTHENRVSNNFEVTNATRACILPTPSNLGDPEKFLGGVFEHILHDIQFPTTDRRLNGSTHMSIAMQLNDGRYACAYMGNSPYYWVMQTPSHEIVLKQAINAQSERDHAGDNSTCGTFLHRNSTKTSLPTLAIVSPEEIFTSAPDEKLPENSRCLGMLLCSNGIREGVEYHRVDEDLTKLLRTTPQATPEQIAQCAVKAALPTSSTQITAMFLPAGSKAMVALADGFGHSADIAESAINSVTHHEQYIHNKPNRSGGPTPFNVRLPAESHTSGLTPLEGHLNRDTPLGARNLGRDTPLGGGNLNRVTPPEVGHLGRVTPPGVGNLGRDTPPQR